LKPPPRDEWTAEEVAAMLSDPSNVLNGIVSEEDWKRSAVISIKDDGPRLFFAALMANTERITGKVYPDSERERVSTICEGIEEGVISPEEVMDSTCEMLRKQGLL